MVWSPSDIVRHFLRLSLIKPTVREKNKTKVNTLVLCRYKVQYVPRYLASSSYVFLKLFNSLLLLHNRKHVAVVFPIRGNVAAQLSEYYCTSRAERQKLHRGKFDFSLGESI